jgi:hypothetical protein
MPENELMPRQTITSLVQAHDAAVKLAMEGLEKLSQAQALLERTFGKYKHEVIPRDRLNSYALEVSSLHLTLEESARHIRVNSWAYLLEQTGLEALLSSKRKEEIKGQLKKGEAPPFTVDNAMAHLGHMAGGLDEYFAEAVREVWDWLKPWRSDKLKTNSKSRYELGLKLIKCHLVSFSWGSFSFNHWSNGESHVHDLDKVFHLLDGAGIPKYSGDLVTAMKAAMAAGGRECSTSYFGVRWFKNGNVHFEFLRPDLVQKLNAKAGEGLLKTDQ